LRSHFQNEDDGNILFGRSATGFTNWHLALCFLKHFDRFCPPSRPGRYRILNFDGHDPHISRDFLDYCWQHPIRPFKLPSHTTLLLQPLNVAVFQTLTHWFQVELRHEVFLGAETIDKKDFLLCFRGSGTSSLTATRLHAIPLQKPG